MSLSVIQGALELGLIFAIMSLGIFISFRILNIPDLTIDGTFTLGTSVSAIFAVNGHPVLGVIFALIAGGLAGCVTGFLQTCGSWGRSPTFLCSIGRAFFPASQGL